MRAEPAGVNDEEPALCFEDFEVATPTRSQEAEDEAALAAAEAETDQVCPTVALAPRVAVAATVAGLCEGSLSQHNSFPPLLSPTSDGPTLHAQPRMIVKLQEAAKLLAHTVAQRDAALIVCNKELQELHISLSDHVKKNEQLIVELGRSNKRGSQVLKEKLALERTFNNLVKLDKVKAAEIVALTMQVKRLQIESHTTRASPRMRQQSTSEGMFTTAWPPLMWMGCPEVGARGLPRAQADFDHTSYHYEDPMAWSTILKN